MVDRDATLRRTLEQVEHCITEARSILANGEDPKCAQDDVMQAKDLLEKVVVPALSKLIA